VLRTWFLASVTRTENRAQHQLFKIRPHSNILLLYQVSCLKSYNVKDRPHILCRALRRGIEQRLHLALFSLRGLYEVTRRSKTSLIHRVVVLRQNQLTVNRDDRHEVDRCKTPTPIDVQNLLPIMLLRRLESNQKKSQMLPNLSRTSKGASEKRNDSPSQAPSSMP
jgi:hypothetical protein